MSYIKYYEIPSVKVYEKYPHIGRMMREANDLMDRILKLNDYYHNHCCELTAEQCNMMTRQIDIMTKYHGILSDRIIYDTKYYYKNLIGQEDQ